MIGIYKINKKRLIALFTVICTVCSAMILSNPVTVSAASESHFVEAENYTTTNWTYYGSAPAIANGVASSGKAMMLVSPANAKIDGGSRVKYKVQIQTPGIYQMEICRSPIGAPWTSNLYVSINGGEPQEIIDNGAIQKVNTEFTKYNAQSFVLESGENVFEFIAPEPRESDGRYVMYFDYFKLTNVEQSLTEVTTDAPWNVFQTNEEQIVTFKTQCELQEDTVITYDVVDYFGNMAGFGSVTGKKGESSITCKLEPLPTGHYTVTAKLNGTTAFAYIAVVKPLEERQKIENSPFAMTTAGIQHVSAAQQENYAKILTLAGVGYGREHIGGGWMLTGESPTQWAPASWYNDTLIDMMNEAGIDVLLMTMSSMPGSFFTEEASAAGNKLPDDVMDIYLGYKTIAEHYGDKIGMYEIFNEPDGGYTTANESASIYAAMLKAGYIGVKDAGAAQGKELLVSNAGLQHKEDYFNELVENDMFKYTDIYNDHAHIHAVDPIDSYYSPPTSYSEMINWKNSAGAYDKPVWVTETGIGIQNPAGVNFNRDKQKIEAQFHPENVVQALSEGIDMVYTFIPFEFQEGTRQWGMFTENNGQPYPAYVAYSVMTDVLGQGRFLGTVNTGNEKVKAYWFDSGKNKVLAVWGTEEADVTLNFGANNVTSVDIMGNEKAVIHNGIYQTKADTNIKYYVINGEIPAGTYTPSAKTQILQPTKNTLTKAERVVLLQRFENGAKTDARYNGYGLLPEGNTVRVQAYNFNNETMTGTISGYTDGGWVIENPVQQVEIPPMDSVILEFKVSADGNYSKEKSNLTFIGTFDGQNTSKAVDKITGRNFAVANVTVEDGQTYVEISVKNDTIADYSLTDFAFTLQGKKFENAEVLTIKAGETGTVKFAVDNLTPYEPVEGEVSVVFGGKIAATSTVSVEYNPLNAKDDDSYVIDIGALEIQDAMAGYGGETQGEISSGAEDLSGKFYIGNDSENLYIKGVVTDDIHSQEYDGANVWQGDSVQIGIGSGDAVYGDQFHEFGLSLTPSGPQIYRWLSAGDQAAGLVTTGTIKVTRDETTKQTIYEAVIPLEELAPLSLDADKLKMAIVLNENDGIGRVAYLQWGTGIADSKNVMQFKDVLLSKVQD